MWCTHRPLCGRRNLPSAVTSNHAYKELIYAPVNGDAVSPLQGRVFDIRGRSADLLLRSAAAMDFKKTLTTYA
jgi:hypothetical protein